MFVNIIPIECPLVFSYACLWLCLLMAFMHIFRTTNESPLPLRLKCIDLISTHHPSLAKTQQQQNQLRTMFCSLSYSHARFDQSHTD